MAKKVRLDLWVPRSSEVPFKGAKVGRLWYSLDEDTGMVIFVNDVGRRLVFRMDPDTGEGDEFTLSTLTPDEQRLAERIIWDIQTKFEIKPKEKGEQS